MTTTKAIAHDFNQDGYADLIVLVTARLAPPPSSNGDATPTGEELELKGTVTQISDGYFIVEGIRVNYDPDVLQMEDGFGDTIQVGHPIETTGDEYSDGSITATMIQVG